MRVQTETTADLTAMRAAAVPMFERGLWRIAAANVSHGNRTRLLIDGPEAFAEMLSIIDAAREEVLLESYIFFDDSTGRRFAQALTASAQRGVRVRVLVDWIGSRETPRSFWNTLRSAGVELSVFSPPGFSRRWFGVLPRDHRKLLVVDNSVGITGGFGIGDKWSHSTSEGDDLWRDTAVRIDGPAAADMKAAFELMWRRAHHKERRDSARFARRRLHDSVHSHEGALIAIIEGEPGRFRIARGFQYQSVAAEKAIWLADAYFVPSYSEVEALIGAARDNVDVRVLVPSKSDHPWLRRFTRRVYRTLLSNGVRIWEWQGSMMHAKTSVVDGRWVRVGSTDFNMLGVAINYELDAMIDDPSLGARASEQFLTDLQRSVEIVL